MSSFNSEYGYYIRNGAQPGFNGLTGFKNWECYMLLKYGNSKRFGIGGDYEYLIELPIYPEQVSESIQASWTTQNILGRSSPVSAYANTSLKNVSFSIDLHRDLMTGSFTHTTETLLSAGGSLRGQAAGYQKETDSGPFSTRDWYVNINKMLQMSCYPQYTEAGMIPPTTYFVFGQMILKGFVQSYSTEWKKPIINTFYAWNSVTINMDCYPDTIISARDLITNRQPGSASTQNTYNTRFPDEYGDTSSNVMLRPETTTGKTSRPQNFEGENIIST